MKADIDTPPLFCSRHSISACEPLYGSAPRTDYWLLLEHPHPLQAKAVEESKLPAGVKQRLADLQRSIPALRVLLIRRSGRTHTTDLRLYLANSREPRPVLYSLNLPHADDLLALDVEDILRGGSSSQKYLSDEPITLVCTNGKRDVCCARWGQPLFKALSEMDAEHVWQSSHVGGHRFAPNLILLPEGIYFGRIPLEEAGRLLSMFRIGQMDIRYYRGRAAYPAPAQAGEYFLRRETGEIHIDSYHLLELSQISTDRWQVTFIAPQEGKTYILKVAAAQTGQSIFESCNTPNELKPVIAYHLAGSIQIK